MIRGTVTLHFATYVILSLLYVEGQRLLSLNPLTRSLTPVRMYQYPQSTLKHCLLYNACYNCCTYWYNPTFTTPYKIIPMMYSTVPINRKEQAWYTRPLNNYPMLRVDRTDWSVHSERRDHNSHLSLVKYDDKSTHSSIDNLSQTKAVMINSPNEASDSLITYQKKSYVNIKTSTSKWGFFFNNSTTGRRSNNMENTVLSNIQPSVLQQTTTNPMQLQSTCNECAIVPPIGATTTQTVPNLLQYNHVASLASSFNTSSNNTQTGQKSISTRRDSLFGIFRKTLDRVERSFLLSVFNKLSAISPENRKENGISFLQSGLFLHQLLLSLSITMDKNATQEIEEYFGYNMSEVDKIEILNRTVSWLPKSSDDLKFRWASRLVVQRAAAGASFHRNAARALPLRLSWLSGNETPAHITETLNSMVLSDSGGSMHDTFSEEEVEAGVCAAALGTVYVRGTWRAAPTLLNDTRPFRDAPAAPQRSSRFFRLNDLMGYSYLHEWDAEAIEIPYATPGLSLLILVPKEPSVRPLVERAAAQGLDAVLRVMHTMRIAVTLPLYTLRMTLLLPNKLQDMGMPSLLRNGTDCQPVRLSHAVQRLMFWAEAGRNAFKDDGIEWDPRPELEILVDRPYLFFVRWENITIMNGVFVL